MTWNRLPRHRQPFGGSRVECPEVRTRKPSVVKMGYWGTCAERHGLLPHHLKLSTP
jgi:hypothetical protein